MSKLANQLTVRARRLGLRNPPSNSAYSKDSRRLVTVKLKAPYPTARLAIQPPSLNTAPHGIHFDGAVFVKGMAHSDLPRVGGI